MAQIKRFRIIRPAALQDLLGVSRTTLWRMCQRGELPEPIQISRGCIGWREETIQGILSEREQEAAQRAAARTQAGA